MQSVKFNSQSQRLMGCFNNSLERQRNVLLCVLEKIKEMLMERLGAPRDYCSCYVFRSLKYYYYFLNNVKLTLVCLIIATQFQVGRQQFEKRVKA